MRISIPKFRALAAWLLIVLAGAYAAAVAGLFLAQRTIIYQPDTTPPDAAAAGLPDLQTVTLTTADGLALRAWYLPPEADGPLLVYFHGNGGNVGDRSRRFRRFAAAGLGVLMADYRGYGGNPGRPTEAGLYDDARAALDFAAAQGIPADRQVLWGESLGTGVAVRMASERPVAAVVLEAPYTSLVDLARRDYPWVPSGLLLLDRFASRDRIGQVTAPLLVLHGERDTIIPVAQGRRLLAAASGPREGWFPADAGHTDLEAHGGVEVALRFIRRHVPAGRAPPVR